MEKFRNKYRIPSARLPDWDYAANGAYFITICTKNRECFFGEILNTSVPVMQLNGLGKLAKQYWLAIPAHFPFISLKNFVVMPNHVHGILIIHKTGNDDDRIGPDGIVPVDIDNPVAFVDPGAFDDPGSFVDPDLIASVETLHATSLTQNAQPQNAQPQNDKLQNENLHQHQPYNVQPVDQQMAHISPKSGSISTIIRSYKSVVSKHARILHADFEWQTRFHDHIIRNADSFEMIQNYIANNPATWNNDKFYR